MKWYEKNNIKKKIYLVAAAISVIILLLILTNPSLDKGYSLYRNNRSRSFVSQLVNVVPLVDKSFCKVNFYIFSVFVVKYSTFGKEAIIPVSYGVMGMIFSLEESTKEMNPFEMFDQVYEANKWLGGRSRDCKKL